MKSTFLSRHRYLVLGFAFLGMGIAMPSCPGQQAMQQQLDQLQQMDDTIGKKSQAMDSQVKSLNNDMTQAKQLLEQMTNAIQAQKAAIDQLDQTTKQLQTQLADMQKAKAAQVAKKRAKR